MTTILNEVLIFYCGSDGRQQKFGGVKPLSQDSDFCNSLPDLKASTSVALLQQVIDISPPTIVIKDSKTRSVSPSG